MSTAQLDSIQGRWMGESRLILEGNIYDCDSTAEIHYVGQGQFMAVSYAWSVEGEPQDGLIVFRSELSASPSKATWLDSWHMVNQIMFCDATLNAEGYASLYGTYPAPTGPDWGWRIEVGPGEGGSLVIRMFNITPEGQEELAVLGKYERAGSTAG